jgi:hypothetical protein
MHNERNGATGVRGNRAVNFSALVPHNGLRVSCETLGCHHLCSFRTCDLLARNANGSKKMTFTLVCYRECLIIFHIVWIC